MTDRKAFEAWITGSPYERNVSRFPNDHAKHAWPGNYRDINVDLAWHAWQAATAHEREAAAKILEWNEFGHFGNLAALVRQRGTE